MGREIGNFEYKHLLTSFAVKGRRHKELWFKGKMGTSGVFFNMGFVFF